MDIDNLVAIDVHTHVHRSVNAPPVKPEDNEHLAAMAAYFKTAAASFTVDDLAAYYRERKMAVVAFTIDQLNAPEDPARATPEEIAERARDHADVIIPFGSVDPPPAQPRCPRSAQPRFGAVGHNAKRNLALWPTTTVLLAQRATAPPPV
jgi:hypothetical protein